MCAWDGRVYDPPITDFPPLLEHAQVCLCVAFRDRGPWFYPKDLHVCFVLSLIRVPLVVIRSTEGVKGAYPFERVLYEPLAREGNHWATITKILEEKKTLTFTLRACFKSTYLASSFWADLFVLYQAFLFLKHPHTNNTLHLLYYDTGSAHSLHSSYTGVCRYQDGLFLIYQAALLCALGSLFVHLQNINSRSFDIVYC